MTVRLPAGQDAGRRSVPHLHRVLRLPDGCPATTPLAFARSRAEYDPLAPAPSTAVGSVVGPLLDFAVVSVQMRGTGCSGGAFDLFGLPDAPSTATT